MYDSGRLFFIVVDCRMIFLGESVRRARSNWASALRNLLLRHDCIIIDGLIRLRAKAKIKIKYLGRLVVRAEDRWIGEGQEVRLFIS